MTGSSRSGEQLAAEIVRSLGEGAQHTVAPTFGIPQPRMSELNRGVVDHCSVEWLIRRIYRLGGTVTVSVALGDAGRAWMRDRTARMRDRSKLAGPRERGPVSGSRLRLAGPAPGARGPAPGRLIPELE